MILCVFKCLQVFLFFYYFNDKTNIGKIVKQKNKNKNGVLGEIKLSWVQQQFRVIKNIYLVH